MVTIVLAGERVQLSPDDADALAAELWKGRVPGAAVAAGRLTDAISSRSARSVVTFEAHEAETVRAALRALSSPD